MLALGADGRQRTHGLQAGPLFSVASGPLIQKLDPVHSTLGGTLVALIPIAVLLILLAVLRMSAWQAVVIGAAITIILAITVWGAPAGTTFGAWAIGAGSGVWSIDWITFWGVIIYNTLVETGAFGDFKRWLVAHATADIRVQTILMAWALGALLEGLVGFGYPWAVITPILLGLGVAELDAIRVAALANNAPVSFGALGAPIIALATVTGIPLIHLSAAIGRIVAILALLPPWILILLVTGRRGLRGAWPLALVGSFAYILGQYPTSQYLALVAPGHLRLHQAHGDLDQLAVPPGGQDQLGLRARRRRQLAHGFSRVGTAFIVLSPILGWIGVALSGSNTSANALFGGFQYSLGGLLKMPPLILPALNSVGAEIGKPVAPQTASVGVSTSQFVRKEGQVIRHNLGWTLILLGYLILIALFYRFVLPAAMR